MGAVDAVKRPAALLAAALLLGSGTPAAAPVGREDAHLRRVGGELRRLHLLNARLRQALRHAPSVQEALSLASVAYGVPRWQLAAVAGCESHQQAGAYNRSSGATGLMQFLPSTFAATPFGRAGLSIWSPYANVMAAAWKVREEGGFGAWTCRP